MYQWEKKLWAKEIRLRGMGENEEIETQLSNTHVCKLHNCWSVQFYFTTVHVNVWCTNIDAKRKNTMFLQSCSRPQAVRAHEKKSTHQVGLHTKIAQDIVQEGKLSTRFQRTLGKVLSFSTGKDPGIIRCAIFFLCVMMRNGYTIETNKIMNGLKTTKISFNGFQ